MKNIYVKLRRKKIKRTMALDEQVNIDRGEDEEIVGIELLDVCEITVNGKKI